MESISQCNCTALRKAARRLSQLYDTTLASSGLKSTQYSILAEIARRLENPLTMRELSASLVMDRSTLGHNLRPLERDGLVELVVGPADKRERRLKLTAAGQSMFAEAKPLWLAAQRQFERSYGTEKAAKMRITLTAIAAADFGSDSERNGAAHVEQS